MAFKSKTATLLLLFLILLLGLFSSQARQTEAQFFTITSVPILEAIEGEETGHKYLRLGLDVAAKAAAQLAIERIVASTVKWANSGFEGNPAYVTDAEQYFTDLADGIAGRFIEEDEALGFLCSPFQANIRLSLIQEYYEPLPFQCTLTEVVDNIEGFYDDFSQGGWDAWFSMTQNPTNNPYGAYLKARVELDSRIASAVGLQNKQLEWNQGYLSWATCEKSDPYTGECLKRGPVRTPGGHIKAQLDKIIPSGLEKLISVQHIEDLVEAFAAGLLQKYVFGSEGLFADAAGDTSPTPTSGGEAVDIDGDGILDGLDTNNDGRPDICYYGGISSPSTPPCRGSQDTSKPPYIPGPDGGGSPGSCQAVTRAGVEAITKKYQPNDAGIRQALPELKTAFGSQVTIYGTTATDFIDKINFGGGMTVDVISNAGTASAAWVWQVLTPCSGGGEGDGTIPASLKSDLEAERAKYGTYISSEDAGKILNAVAWSKRELGWGLSQKDGGNKCPMPSGGTTVACDVLYHQPSRTVWDVFTSDTGDFPDNYSGRVTWGRITSYDFAGRPWVAPVAP